MSKREKENSFKIFETKNFSNDIKKLPKNEKFLLINKLNLFVYPQIKNNPHYGANIKKLKDWDPPNIVNHKINLV